MEPLIIIVFFWLLFGAIGYEMAKTRGRRKALGFISGLFFGPITIVYYLLAGNSNDKQIEIQRAAIRAEKDNIDKKII
jgi:hypothetical protein